MDYDKDFNHKYYLNRKEKHAKICASYYKKNKEAISLRKKQWYLNRKTKNNQSQNQ